MSNATGVRKQFHFMFGIVMSIASVGAMGALGSALPAAFLLNQKAAILSSVEAIIAQLPSAAVDFISSSNQREAGKAQMGGKDCLLCGVIESVSIMETPSGESGLLEFRKHGAYRLTVRMNDGSAHTVYHSLPGFRIRTKVYLEDGTLSVRL